MVGGRSLAKTLYFEWCCWLAPVPGAIGLLLRKIFWSRLFGSCGAGTVFGANIVVRHPHRIHLGKNVVLGEGVVLDGRHDTEERVLLIDDDVMLANYVTLSCKSGTLHIGSNTGIGTHTVIQSTNDCPVNIGQDVIIGPHSYIVAGGSYHTDRGDVSIRDQGIKPDTGCIVEDNVWLGGGVTVIGGVTMASGSVAAAGAVVTRSVGSNVICGGVPARVLKDRVER